MERRKENRTVKKLYVRLNSGSITCPGLLYDVSENGLFVSSIKAFPIGAELNIEIFMPDNNRSFLKGIVRRKLELFDSYRKNGLGIELTKRDERYTGLISSDKSEIHAVQSKGRDQTEIEAVSLLSQNNTPGSCCDSTSKNIHSLYSEHDAPLDTFSDINYEDRNKIKKIIITDALKDFVQQQVSLLTGLSDKIFYIGSGREVLNIHRKEKTDLIIIKLDFPDMTCEQLCSIIRRDEALKTVSILIVCSDKLSDIERCKKCGANDYIDSLFPETFLRKTLSLLNVSERTNYRVIVKLSRRENNNIRDIFCTSRNISPSGILLETLEILNRGDKVTCSFFLPNSIRIVIEGEIVRLMEEKKGLKCYGVRFVDIPSSVELQIASFIESWRKRRKRVR
jgi:CheY-like chemotaxis protein